MDSYDSILSNPWPNWKGTYQLVSKPLDPILEGSRELSASSRSSRRGSPEGRRSVAEEERLSVLEGTVLTLHSKFDRMLENNSRTERLLEELVRSRGNGAPPTVMASPEPPVPPPPIPPPPQIPAPVTSQYTTSAIPSILGHHHLPQFGAGFIGVPNPMFPLEPNLFSPQIPDNLRSNLGPIPQLESRTSHLGPPPQFEPRTTGNKPARTFQEFPANQVSSQQTAISPFTSTPTYIGTQLGMSTPNPMLSLEPNLHHQQINIHIRASPGQLSQFEQGTPLNQCTETFQSSPLFTATMLEEEKAEHCKGFYSEVETEDSSSYPMFCENNIQLDTSVFEPHRGLDEGFNAPHDRFGPPTLYLDQLQQQKMPQEEALEKSDASIAKVMEDNPSLPLDKCMSTLTMVEEDTIGVQTLVECEGYEEIHIPVLYDQLLDEDIQISLTERSDFLFDDGQKETPEQPNCDCSKKVVNILKNVGVEFKKLDILTDDEVHEVMKEFSNWPTYLQLYCKGEFLGGLIFWVWNPGIMQSQSIALEIQYCQLDQSEH